MAPCAARSSARACLEVGARRKPAEQLGHAVHAAIHHRGGQMVRAGHDVRDDLGLRGIRNGRLEHADDRRRAVAEPDRLADDGGVAVERRAPEAMRQHRRARSLGAIVSRVEQAAEHRSKPHHAEVRAADDAGADDAGSPRPTSVKSTVEKSPKAAIGLHAARAGRGSRAPRSWRSRRRCPCALWRM